MVRNIQVLRCFAALAVVVRHAMMWLGAHPPLGMLWVGRAGVDVFFVISGFIMFHTNQSGERTAFEFWIDRLIRIAPLYWVAMLPVIVLFFAGLPDGDVSHLTFGAIVKDFLFLPHIRGDGDALPLLNVGWTLTYEMFFYAIFGLTFFLRSQIKSLIALTTIFIGGWLVTRFANQGLPYAFDWYAKPITLEFAGGGLLALLYRRPPILPERASRFLGFSLVGLGIVGLFIAARIGGEAMGEPTAFRTLMYGPPAVTIVAGALLLEQSGVAVRNRSLLFFGEASYSLYLAHTLVLVYAAQVYAAWFRRSAGATVLIGIVAVGLAIVAGVAMHLLIEKPLTVRLRAAVRRIRRPASNTVAAKSLVPLALRTAKGPRG